MTLTVLLLVLFQEVFIPPSEDELLCAMLYNNEISADITDEDNTVDDTVLIGSSSGRIYVCNFNEMKLVEVEQTFGGAVIAFKQVIYFEKLYISFG